MKYNKTLTKEFLIKEYIDNKKSSRQIAKEFGYNFNAVLWYLRKLNIPTRKNCYKGKRNVRYIDGRCSKKHYCIESDCNNEISLSNYYSGNRRCQFCSNKGERNPFFGSHIFTGENNPSYIDGRSNEPYPLEFNDELKAKIRKRDDYTCQNCGMTEEEHLIVIGYNLINHHIDYNKMNCKETNLISLCDYCNSRVNFNRKYWENYFKNKLKGVIHNGQIISIN